MTTEAEQAGFDAATTKQPLHSNPHKVGTAEYQKWEAGWWEGFYWLDLDREEERRHDPDWNPPYEDFNEGDE